MEAASIPDLVNAANLAKAEAERLRTENARLNEERNTAVTEAEEARERAHLAEVQAAKYRIALEHYAAPVSDSGTTARRALNDGQD